VLNPRTAKDEHISIAILSGNCVLESLFSIFSSAKPATDDESEYSQVSFHLVFSFMRACDSIRPFQLSEAGRIEKLQDEMMKVQVRLAPGHMA
jgi:hypothetical protein